MTFMSLRKTAYYETPIDWIIPRKTLKPKTHVIDNNASIDTDIREHQSFDRKYADLASRHHELDCLRYKRGITDNMIRQWASEHPDVEITHTPDLLPSKEETSAEKWDNGCLAGAAGSLLVGSGLMLAGAHNKLPPNAATLLGLGTALAGIPALVIGDHYSKKIPLYRQNRLVQNLRRDLQEHRDLLALKRRVLDDLGAYKGYRDN